MSREKAIDYLEKMADSLHEPSARIVANHTLELLKSELPSGEFTKELYEISRNTHCNDACIALTQAAKEIDRLEEQLKAKEKIISHIMTCLSIIKNTTTAEGLKDTPSLAKELQEYIKQALKP